MSIANLFTDNPKEYQSIQSNTIKVDGAVSSVAFPTAAITITNPVGRIQWTAVGTISSGGGEQILTVNYAPFDPATDTVLVSMRSAAVQSRKLRVYLTDPYGSGQFGVVLRNDGTTDATGTDYEFNYAVL